MTARTQRFTLRDLHLSAGASNGLPIAHRLLTIQTKKSKVDLNALLQSAAFAFEACLAGAKG